MNRYVNVKRLHKPLEEAGLVPPNCRLLDLAIGTDGALIVRYDVLVTAEQLVALGEVFARIGNDIIEGKSHPFIDPEDR
jgi:hypothetical protein